MFKFHSALTAVLNPFYYKQASFDNDYKKYKT